MINWRPRANLRAGAARHVQQRAAAGAAIDPDHVRLHQVPAEERNPFQFALEDEQRLLEELQQRKGLPHRLMFRGDDQRSLGNFLEPAILHLGVADHAHQPDAAARPGLGDRHDGPARHQEGRDRDDQPEHQQRVEQHVVDQRTQENQKPSNTRSVGLSRRRPARRQRSGRLVREFGRQIETDIGQPHPHFGGDIFGVLR